MPEPELVHLELVQRHVRELVQAQLVRVALGILPLDVLIVVREGAEASLLLHVVVVLAKVFQELVEGLLHVLAGLVGTRQAQQAARDAECSCHCIAQTC